MFDKRLRAVETEMALHGRDHQWKAATETPNADLVARLDRLEKLVGNLLQRQMLPTDDKPATGTEGSYL